MPRYRYAPAIVLGLCLAALDVCAQTSLHPERGLLLLRNGQVLAGDVTRAGDYYVVTQGPGVELRLAARDVEAFCASLDEAYEFKERRLAAGELKPHLDLAEWCLRHNLHARCADQLVAAMRITPADPRLASLENRLKLAAESQESTAEPEAAGSSALSADELEQKLQSLPKASVEKFSSIVQPILLNRCGANQCHGPNSKSEFSLLKPPAGQVASRRFTQRNLYAALRYVNSSQPEESPLITLPQRRHGAALTPVFDKHTQNQLAELIAWSRMTTGVAAPTVLKTIAAPTAILSQPAATPQITPAGTEPTAEQPTKVMRPRLDEADDAASVSTKERFIPRDAYDPEIFNRRFHGPR